MQQERWQRIDEIFHSALQRDGKQRAAFLEETCSGDMLLRLEVERLLTNYEEAGSFLEEPAMQLAARAAQSYSDDPSMEGEMILHYRVGARLGCGGMGVVYRGEDLKLGRGVAMKFLYDDGTRATRAGNKLLAEARAASSLNHPNICTIYAVEEHRGQAVLVMELLEGETLRDRMKTRPISVQELIGLGLEACDALGAAHAKGIVHRDIKPANIFLGKDGRLKLLDFGIAKWMHAEEAEERSSHIAGTMLYMSPEQLRGEGLDGRSDLFSLGLVLYEAATGTHPFERSNPVLTIEAVLHDSVAGASRANPAVPASLDRVIGRMLEKDRERRYHSAADVARDLELVDGRTPRMRSQWKLAGIAAAVALCGMAVLYHERRPAPVLTNRDTIVLADFANKTGDPIFDNTLRQALDVELRQSPFLSLISEERIQHALRLMATPPDTPLTAATAREVCERTGSTAVLDGNISSLGSQYVLLLRAENCRTGELLFAGQSQAGRKEDVLRAISELAGMFRKRGGESLTTIAQHSTPISDATTPSLEAWKSFSEGMRLMILQGHVVGIPFLKRAVEIDPHSPLLRHFWEGITAPLAKWSWRESIRAGLSRTGTEQAIRKGFLSIIHTIAW